MEPASLTIGPNPIRQGQALTIRLFNEFADELELMLTDPHGAVVRRWRVRNTVVLEEVRTEGIGKGEYTLRISGGCIQAERHIIIQ